MKKGFTLIELLVVVLIIGILSAIALPQYTTAVEKARSAEALTLMSNLRYAGERYRLQTGYFPGDQMDVLDIEVPGFDSTNKKAVTKNFVITTSGGGSSDKSGESYTITATRAQNGSATTGTSEYVLKTVVTPAGSAIRSCTGDTTLCKAITSGKTDDF